MPKMTVFRVNFTHTETLSNGLWKHRIYGVVLSVIP